ncbi:MAG: hypothetical protein IH989_03570 [Planctomycetes bacterium]|nr:hypothetical protein [Planctomycetota bacterium]
MTVESNTADVRHSEAPIAPARPPAGGRSSDWLVEPDTVDLMSRLPGAADRYVACAPGRLDVMGGLAEYSGSSIVNMPIGGRVLVGVEPRRAGASTPGSGDDLSIICWPPSDSGNGAATSCVVPLAQLFDEGGKPIEADRARSRQADFVGLIDRTHADDAWCALATLVEMCRAGVIPRLERGLVIAIGSTLSGLAGVAAETSVSAATAAALAGLHDVAPQANRTVAVCQRVANRWLDLPIGIGDAYCVLHGEADTLHLVECATSSLGARINLSDRLSVIGIECGGRSSDATEKFIRARVAAFMGRGLIERIVRHENPTGSSFSGLLSSVSVEDYVERFRDRLPTKLKGSEYLERFGETGDSLTRIDPSCTYKVRSRTEHHIYEHTRVSQFLKCIRRAGENPPEQRDVALREAGELMYASHWSYGQRCGLGSVHADLLVNLLRRYGTGKGIFGAKITGRGCGGVVAVLAKTGRAADDAIASAIEAFDSQTGCSATLLRSTDSGAFVTGVRKV